MKLFFALVLTIPFFASLAQADSLPIGSRFKRVVQVVFENTNFAAALKQPDFAALVKRGALLTRLSAQNHPSQGNYIAMAAADTLGVASDGIVNLNSSHIGDLLEQAHLSWKVFAEGYPGNCYTGSSRGQYVRKHNPFISFTNVSGNPKRCGNIVGAEEFANDVNASALPEYSMFVPDLRNDGHDTGVDFAGKYLSKTFGPLLDDQKLMADTLFIFTFDENSGASGNQVFTVLVGGNVRPGSTFDGAISHPGLVRLVEEEFRLGSLHRLDETSLLIDGIWK
jgi:hypothetical protein